MLSQRSHEPEWMDLGSAYYTLDEYRDCLFQLDRVGRLLGGDRATFLAIESLTPHPTSILDVGCGGGIFTLRLAKRYPQTKIVGIDISKEAIAFAQEQLYHSQPPLSNVQFLVPTSHELDSSLQCDVIIATLVCHHLSDSALVSFLEQACKIAKQAVILNDLHRHPLASCGFGVIAPFVFRNRMILHDGLLSIRRSFTHQEWWNFLQAAQIDNKLCTVKWHCPFRWIVTIQTTHMWNAN